MGLSFVWVIVIICLQQYFAVAVLFWPIRPKNNERCFIQFDDIIMISTSHVNNIVIDNK